MEHGVTKVEMKPLKDLVNPEVQSSVKEKMNEVNKRETYFIVPKTKGGIKEHFRMLVKAYLMRMQTSLY